MRRINRKPEDKRAFECPQCEKSRMIRPIDHVVFKDRNTYNMANGESVILFADICDWCKKRNYKKYFEPQKANVRRVLKTLHDDSKLADDQSLEDLL